MGATVVLALAVLSFCGGVVCLIAGAVGVVLFSRLTEKGSRVGTPLTAVSGVAAGVGSLMIALPLAFLAFISYENASSPPDYEEIGIRIEGYSYDDEYFTADGVVYELLEQEANYEACEAVAEPVFYYKEVSFLCYTEAGNLYRLENERELDLIWDGGYALYCRPEEREAVLAYIQASVEWFCYGEEGLIPVDAAMIPACMTGGETGTAQELLAEEYQTLGLIQTGADGLVRLGLWELYAAEGEYYAFQWYDEEYYVYENEAGLLEICAPRAPEADRVRMEKLFEVFYEE